MKRGKKICKTLKEVRMQVAKANDIDYVPAECHHEGDCAGTCPKCEAEVRYLERQLSMRRQLGKAVAVVGVSVGLAALSACKTHKTTPTELGGDVTVGTDAPTIEMTEGIVPMMPDTTAVEVEPVAEESTEAIYGENSDIPDTVDPPTYPGGMAALSQFLNENIKYPKEAEKAKIEGRVLVGFIVDVDGAISESRVEHSSHPLLDREALRVIRLMPAWNPAKEKASGKPVKVRYHLPVTFKL
jgi:TonB family protein